MVGPGLRRRFVQVTGRLARIAERLVVMASDNFQVAQVEAELRETPPLAVAQGPVAPFHFLDQGSLLLVAVGKAVAGRQLVALSA